MTVILGMWLAVGWGLTPGSLSPSVADTISSLSQGVHLDTVVVYGRHHQFGVQSSQMSAVAIDKQQVMSIPTFMGEPDVLKTLQKYPGVQSSNDGTASVFVRGGDYDQNYITLDGSALYNAEHMKGFVSAINPDMVQNINFYRGAFPARYGSRLSSVIDVGIKTGNFEHYHGLLSVGVLSSRFHIEGPIWRKRTSFNIAGRFSYVGLVAKPILRKVYDKPEALRPYENMNYYDISAKIVHQFSSSQRLSAVLYYGIDKDDNAVAESSIENNTLSDSYAFYYQQMHNLKKRRSSMNNNWSNLVSSIYWTATFNKAVTMNTNLSYSQYKYRLGYDKHIQEQIEDHYRDYYNYLEETSISFNNDISDLALTVDLDYHFHKVHLARGGFKLSYQWLKPMQEIDKNAKGFKYNGPLNDDNEFKPNPEYLDLDNSLYYVAGNEMTIRSAALYLEDEWTLNDKFKLNMGLRHSAYFVTSKSYFSLEPRLSVRYMLNDHISLKASYSHMTQAIHRLVSSNLVMASDIWVPTTKDIPLMKSHLYGAGINLRLPLGFDLSVEGYYKTMDNVLDYRDGASYTSGMGTWQEKVVLGEGKSYGAECLLERHVGNTTGWISYTWSKALRQFDRPGQEIDGGREFYSPTDHRHNFNATLSHRFLLSRSVSIDLTASWSYITGRCGTIPDTYLFAESVREFDPGGPEYGFVRTDISFGGYDLFGTVFGSSYNSPTPHYTYRNRNGYRLPANHHLDVSGAFSWKNRYGTSSVTLSVYNIYNRMNVSNVYIGYEGNQIALKGICPFPIMPSISISHQF